MNYPVWVVPYIGGGWVIGIIAIIHVFISHFAVGGGAFLAVTEQLAYDRKDEGIYNYLKDHSRFFVLITTVAGAVTGVAIWFAVSLVSPDGIHMLIQNFTLAWALEYVFFVAELATAFAYYYSWDKISRKQHLNLARIYFGLSVFTLVIINGVLTFMLTPGSWIKSHYWLEGVFNPTYFPSLFLRLLIMFAIAGMYAMVTSCQLKDEHLRTFMVRFCARWMLPVFIAGPFVGLWYLNSIPQAAVANIFTGIQSSGIGNFSILARVLYLSLILSGTITLFAFFGPYLNPRGFTFRIAILFMIWGLAVTGATEYMRELLRKPFVVYDYMYSNGIRKDDLARIDSKGFIESGVWAKASAKCSNSQIGKGEVIFRYQCMGCHTTDGYRGIKGLVGERDEVALTGFLHLIKGTDKDSNPYLGIMPPLVGNDDEIEALSAYLCSLKGNPRQTAEGKSLDNRIGAVSLAK